MSLFNISLIRKFFRLFSASTPSISNPSPSSSSREMQQNVLLISADQNNRDELTEQLNTWGYQVEWHHSAEEALYRLTASTDSGYFQFLILDRRHLDVDPKKFIIKLQHLQLLDEITTILVGPQQFKREQALLTDAGYHFQVATPLDTRILFTALHAQVQDTENSADVPNLLEKFNESYPRLPAKRILLAVHDDETIELVTTTLESQGHIISIAEDGQQALIALETEIFDIVVIDKELPLLSGMQVINIHHLDCPTDQWKPFILLFEKGIHENYQSSRIKAHLTKPINSQQLTKTLHDLAHQQYIAPINRPTEQPRLQRHTPSISHIEKATLVDQSILKELDAMGTDSNFIHQLIHLFEEDGRTTINELAEAVESNDFTHFKEVIHLLLDSSSFLGTTQLYELSLSASQIDQSRFTSSATHMLKEIEATFNATNFELFQYLSKKTDSLSNS
ncbi:MAG: hypothetical protein L3J28_05565 [Candidatus Polarisedimenticolaceae bacterium]|nr:hypothetical protein [Candidatus Polarisedimenticolaceae bacterium]